MTSFEDKPRKTKKQLKRAARNYLFLALLLCVFPLPLILEYRKFGYIYPDKMREIMVTGNDALTIIYGMSITAGFVCLIAVYNSVRCLIKIRRGEYSTEDESPEFVICSSCGTPQNSKDLLSGHCSKCTGNVENLEGYYERHSDLAHELNKQSIQQGKQNTSTEFNTCRVCGKTFYHEDCPGLICRDCQSIK